MYITCRQSAAIFFSLVKTKKIDERKHKEELTKIITKHSVSTTTLSLRDRQQGEAVMVVELALCRVFQPLPGSMVGEIAAKNVRSAMERTKSLNKRNR